MVLIKPLPSESCMQTVSVDNFYSEMLSRSNISMYFCILGENVQTEVN